MKTTNCPKCNSDSVFVRPGGMGWGVKLMVSGVGFGMRSTDEWETHLCTHCGYFENYLRKKEWLHKIQTDPQKAGWSQ